MKLNFGCGHDIKHDFYNVDVIEAKGINKSFNFDKFPYPLPKDKFEYVLLNQVLEHLIHPRRVLDELWNSCKNNAIIEISVPYVGSKSAYYDLEHKSYFNDRSFYSLCTPNDSNKNFIKKFEIVDQKIISQRYLKWIPKRILSFLAVFLNNIHVQIDVKIKVIK